MSSVGDNSEALPCQDIVDDLEQSIREEIEMLAKNIPSNPCIFKIPQNLREINPKAYTPCRVAIGPYHAGAKQLKSMEPYKRRYLASLMSRSSGKCTLKDYVTEIAKRESKAWECYSDIEELRNQLDSRKFKKMLLLDGAFIVELLCRKFEKELYNTQEPPTEVDRLKAFLSSSNGLVSDPIVDNITIEYEVLMDLILLENQLPYFILEALFDCTFSGKNNQAITLPQLVYYCVLNKFIPFTSHVDLFPDEESERAKQERVIHLVHFMRMCCLCVPGGNHSCTALNSLLINHCFSCLPTSGVCSINSPRLTSLCLELEPQRKRRQHREEGEKEKQDVDSFAWSKITATELREVGIKFEKAEESQLIHIKFDEARRVIEMPYIIWDEGSEIFFRNVIAFEQYYCSDYSVTNYMFFMVGLIDTIKDVEILEECEVMKSLLESKQDLATIFNNITRYTYIKSTPEWNRLAKDLTAYFKKPWNKWKVMLHRDYFSSPWAAISLIAAILLLLLTAVQTIASVKSTWFK